MIDRSNDTRTILGLPVQRSNPRFAWEDCPNRRFTHNIERQQSPHAGIIQAIQKCSDTSSMEIIAEQAAKEKTEEVMSV